MKLVIGLVGEKGSGKQTFVNFLKNIAFTSVIPSDNEESQDYKNTVSTDSSSDSVGTQNDNKELIIRQVRFSDILAQTLLIWDIPNTRENLQKLSIAMKNSFGQEALAHAAEFNIENETADIIILDGARRESEVEIIKKQTPSLLVYITADQKLRFERLKNRSEKVGETGLSLEQFMKEETVETETLIPKLGKQADVKIENNGTLEEFKKKIQDFYDQYIV